MLVLEQPGLKEVGLNRLAGRTHCCCCTLLPVVVTRTAATNATSGTSQVLVTGMVPHLL